MVDRKCTYLTLLATVVLLATFNLSSQLGKLSDDTEAARCSTDPTVELELAQVRLENQKLRQLLSARSIGATKDSKSVAGTDVEPEPSQGGTRKYNLPPGIDTVDELVASKSSENDQLHGNGQLSCSNWAVMNTTSQQENTLLSQLNKLEDWCVCLIDGRDSRFPGDVSKAKKVVVLSNTKSRELGYETTELLRWNHLSGKNICFLYAVQHGAQLVYDTEGSHILKLARIPFADEFRSKHGGFTLRGGKQPRALNPLVSFANGHIWPRGFPIDWITVNETAGSYSTEESLRNVMIVQSLIDHDPDVDAIFRTTRNSPFEFESGVGLDVLIVPEGRFSPFSSYATGFYYEAFWSLFLPSTVHSRVADIWRSYLVQRIMWDIGGQVGFTSPFVHHCNENKLSSLKQDLISESPLYERAGELIESLHKWVPMSKTIQGRLVEGVILLYELKYIDHHDVKVAIAWVRDLVRVGYKFPNHLLDVEKKQNLKNVMEVNHSERNVKRCKSRAIITNTCDIDSWYRYFYGFDSASVNQVPSAGFQVYDPLVDNKVDLSKFKFISFDTHSAPNMDMADMLVNDFKVPKENLFSLCTFTYCKIHQRERTAIAQLNPKIKQTEARDWLRSLYKFRGTKQKVYDPDLRAPQHKELVKFFDQFDVFVCTYPGWQCTHFRELFPRKVILIRYSHTADHGLPPKNQMRTDWDARVLEIPSDPRTIVTSNNLYHARWHFDKYGYPPLPLPAVYQYARGVNRDIAYNPFVMGDKYVGYFDNLVKYTKIGFETISKAMSMVTPELGWNYTTPHEISGGKAFTMEDISHFSVIVVMPYAAHTAKFNEYYALGIPMMFPSMELAIRALDNPSQVASGDYVSDLWQHTAYAFRSPWEFCKKTDVQNPTKLDYLKHSLPFVEFYNWPHIYYFDSFDASHLNEKVAEVMNDVVERKRRSIAMRKFYAHLRNFQHGARARVSMALDRALRLYEADNISGDQ